MRARFFPRPTFVSSLKKKEKKKKEKLRLVSDFEMAHRTWDKVIVNRYKNSVEEIRIQGIGTRTFIHTFYKNHSNF